MGLEESQIPVEKDRNLEGRLRAWWNLSTEDEEERKYVSKINACPFSYIMLGYFIKYQDQINTNNAFVSGMKEDLKLYRNERNWLNTYLNIGIIIAAVPAQLTQLKLTGINNFTLSVSLPASWNHVHSQATPLSSAPSTGPRSKRVAFFEQSSALASMFGGYLQVALYTRLNGQGGPTGWPGYSSPTLLFRSRLRYGGIGPSLTYLTTLERSISTKSRERGVVRMVKIGRAAPKKLTLKGLKKIYTSWHIWAFIISYLMVANASSGSQYFSLWLKAEKYSVVLVNTIPTTGGAIQVVASFLYHRKGRTYCECSLVDRGSGQHFVIELEYSKKGLTFCLLPLVCWRYCAVYYHHKLKSEYEKS
ncbi:uncharacterized protein PAC_11840 [Phialocephala subalpina]|uniref:Uncharacterized protein n=1 Tax=Phialocephala subalpina TaxID=576137 RepID=A0A1L7XA80_9HELO|nr:uncharacterized protein PAC_11840 [Phialocephala subalpina]